MIAHTPFSERTPSENRPIRLLHLEDHPFDAELIRRRLQADGFSADITWVAGKDTFESAVDREAFDLLLSDNNLPDYDGMLALRYVQEKQPELPVIIISGGLSEEEAVDFLKAGATDYVLKQRLERLASAVRRALVISAERKKLAAAESALQNSELRFRSLVIATSQIVWVTTPSGEAIEDQTHWNGFTGLSNAEAAGWGWTKAIHPDDVDRTIRLWRHAVESGTNFEAQIRMRRNDGEYRHTVARGVPVRAKNNSIREWVGTNTDITESIQAEERIKRLSRIHMLLSGINTLIVRTNSRQRLFEDACRLAVEQGGFAFAWIGALAEGTSELRPMASAGAADGYLTEVSQTLRTLLDPTSVTGTTLLKKQVVLANDIEHDPVVSHRQEALSRGFRSGALFPFLVDGTPVGCMVLYTTAVGYFDADEVRLLGELAGNIAYAIDHLKKISQLDYLAYYNPVTGLPNRALFIDRCNQMLIARNGDDPSIALLYMDLERFRYFNEMLGRNRADTLLKQVAARLKTLFGDSADVAHIDGDNFAVLMRANRGATDTARILKDEIIPAIGAPIELDGNPYRLSIKAGIALSPADGGDAASLLQNAESALVTAKRAGERWLFYEPEMNARVGERLTMERKLRVALEMEQFVLYYQPKIDLATGQISGLEALIRWNDPDTGLVPPLQFIPLLEETGLISEVGRWALKKAVSDFMAWQSKGLEVPRIAVNVSPIQLRQKNFVNSIATVMNVGKSAGAKLELEITESVIMHDVEANIQKLRAILEMGVDVAIDDFGTGYSSLSYIAKLPINALKIDRAFVADMTTNSDNLSIVSTIISIAHSLKLRVVAEGVETPGQAKLLRLLKCNEIQGYLFSPAVPVAQIEQFLRDKKTLSLD